MSICRCDKRSSEENSKLNSNELCSLQAILIVSYFHESVKYPLAVMSKGVGNINVTRYAMTLDQEEKCTFRFEHMMNQEGRAMGGGYTKVFDAPTLNFSR